MATANDGFDALIREAERAAGLVAMLPDLKRLKSAQAAIDDAKAKVATLERRAAELAEQNKIAAAALDAGRVLVDKAKAAAVDAEAKAKNAAGIQVQAAAAQADGIVTVAKNQAAQILKEANAEAGSRIAAATDEVVAKRAEIARLNASIDQLNREHSMQAGKLAAVQRQRDELRRSL